MGVQLKFFVILTLLFVLYHSAVTGGHGNGLTDSEEDLDYRGRNTGNRSGRTYNFTHQRRAKRYHGCYRDTGERMLKRHYDFGDASTIEHCINFCTVEGYVYAGIQFHTQCFCGNMFPKNPPHPKLDESECDKPCRGNPSQMCGGLWANKVFETGNEIFVIKADGTVATMEDEHFWRQ